MTEARDPRHLVLIGLMGSGKSTVGERCAERLEIPFVDTDAAVEADTGRTVPELFATGESAFRAEERRVVAAIAARREPHVVACGGGVVLDPTNAAALRANGTVVWLRATPATLAARVGDGAGRPLLAGADVEVRLTELAAARADAYAAAADAVVDTDGRTLGDVATAVLAAARIGVDRGSARVDEDRGAE